MRALAVFVKSLREQARDPWVLVLTLVSAPIFVLLYWLITGGGSTTYTVLVLDEDGGARAAEAISSIRRTAYPDGQPMIGVTPVGDRERAERMIEEREAMALVVIPEGFSRSIDAGSRPSVTLVGDVGNPYYTIAAVMTTASVSSYVERATGREPVLEFGEDLMGTAERTEFEHYVPGVLMIAIMMMLFAASMSVAREIESGTLARLRMTRMSALDFLAGASGAQIVVGLAALGLTILVARLLGFRSVGPLWAAFAIGALAAVSVVGIGLAVACFSRTVVRAFLVANLPFMMLMFFSGAAFPMPRIPVWTVGARTIGLFDFLPTTHAVNALGRILSLGAGPSGVLYEIVMLAVLSALYFALGVALFHRRHLRG